jgi:type II secretory pathway component GspD/PulD (secretin)
LIIGSAIGLYAASAQEPGRAKPAPADGPAQPSKPADDAGAKNKRTVYVVKHGAAKTLATTLAQHFRGVAEVQVLPDSPSNCLLISCAPAVFDEVVKVVDQLDRRPQLVAVYIWIVDVTGKKSADGSPVPEDKELAESAFTGSIKDVVAKLEALQKKGKISGLKRLQLTATENQVAMALLGETKSFVTAVNTAPNGKVNRTSQFRTVGASAQLILRVTPDNVVLMDITLKDNRLQVPENGIALGVDENKVPIRATEFIDANLKTKLKVASGQAVAAQGVETTPDSSGAQTLIIVGAQVLAMEAQANK